MNRLDGYLFCASIRKFLDIFLQKTKTIRNANLSLSNPPTDTFLIFITAHKKVE